MLDLPVWKQQLRADHSDLGLHRQANESFEPAGVNHLNVIVEKNQHWRIGDARAIVAELGIVKWLRTIQYTIAWIGAKFLQQRACSGLPAAVIYDDDIE